MADMELVRMFNSELSSMCDGKPPVSKAKMTTVTKYAVKAVKYYKHIVHSVEKFVQKCRPEYKVPGLYVIDSIVRQSRHQFGRDKDLFGPRFAKNIKSTFVHFYSCPSDEKPKIVRVLNLWQKNGVYPPEIVQPLIDMASSGRSHSTSYDASPPEDLDDPEPAKPNIKVEYLGVLEQQRQQQEMQIQQLKNQLEQQQQQQQLLQQQLQMQLLQQQKQQQNQTATLLQQQQQIQNIPPSNAPQAARNNVEGLPEMQPGARPMPSMPQPQATDNRNLQGPESYGAAQFMEKFQRMMKSNQDHQIGSHVTDRMNENPLQTDKGKSPGFNQALLDAFDYGDDDNDEQRLAEQRRHLLEDETRLMKSLKESPKYDSKVAGILQKLQENVKMQKSQALQEEMFQPRSDVEDARLMDSRHVARGDPQGNAGSDLPFLGEQHTGHHQNNNNNWSREPAHAADVQNDNRGSFVRIDDRDDDRRRSRDYPHEHASRGNDRLDYRHGMDREDRREDRREHRERGPREWDSRDFRENEGKERERREFREREVREREAREREFRDREARERESRESEVREREAKESEAKEREAREREAREREVGEREAREREANEKETKEKEAREREHREREHRERERRDRDQRDRERRHRDREGGRDRQMDTGRDSSSAQKETSKEPEQQGRKELTVEERWKLGFPDTKKGRLSLCSLTVWVGHLPPRTTAEQLKETFGEFGEVESIDLVQARGCSFIVLKNRRDADLALKQLRNRRFFGHTIRMAWAPGKAIKGSDFKQFWDEDKGVTYIPWDRIRGKSLKDLLDGGVIDPDSLPPGMELEVEPENPPSSEVPMQVPPPGMMGPPPVMSMPPPGLMPFPPGFGPPMPGMPMPGMMPPNFAMGMPPAPGQGLPPQGLPHGMPPQNMPPGPQFNENMPPHPGFDPSQLHPRPGLLDTPLNDGAEFGQNQHGPRPIWQEPGNRFPGPRGPRGFMRPAFEERPPWMQHRPRFPPDQNQARDFPMEKPFDGPQEDAAEPGKQGEVSEIPTEGLSWRKKPAVDTPVKDENADEDKKVEEDSRSKESSEPRPGDKRRDMDDRERSRDRNRDWDRGRNRDRDTRGDRGRDRDRDRDWDRRRFGGRDRDRDRDFGRDRDRDGDRDRGRDRDYDRDRRHSDRGRDRYRSRDRSRDRNRSRDRDRSRGKDRDHDSDRDRDRDRDSDRDRESDRSRSSRDRDRGRSENKTDDAVEEPDVKRIKKEDTESGTAEGAGKENKQDANMKNSDNEDKDDKGGWKKLEHPEKDQSKESKPTETTAKPLMPEGFGFVGPPVKYGSLKPGVQLAAKPSLFDEESKPDRKIDMFSVDSDDEMKRGEKDETKQERKEDTENPTVKHSTEVNNEPADIFEEQPQKKNIEQESLRASSESVESKENIDDGSDKSKETTKIDVAVREESMLDRAEAEMSQDDKEKTDADQNVADSTKVIDNASDVAETDNGNAETTGQCQDDSHRAEASKGDAEGTGAGRDDADRTEARQDDVDRMEARQDDADRTEAPQDKADRTDAHQDDVERTEARQDDADRTEARQDDVERTEARQDDADRTEARQDDVAKTEARQDEADMIEAQQDEADRTEGRQDDAEKMEACQDNALEPEQRQEGYQDDADRDIVAQDEMDKSETIEQDSLRTAESLVEADKAEQCVDDAEMTDEQTKDEVCQSDIKEQEVADEDVN